MLWIISVTLHQNQHLHYIYNISMLKLNNNWQELKGLSHVKTNSLSNVTV